MNEQNQDALRCAEVLEQLPVTASFDGTLFAKTGSHNLDTSSAHIRRLVAENDTLREDLRKFREAASCERDLRQEQERHAAALVQQMLEALRNGGSVCSSVSTSHDRRIRRDGCTLYAQTEEWCKWAEDEIRPQIIAAITAASEWLAPKNNTFKENS